MSKILALLLIVSMFFSAAVLAFNPSTFTLKDFYMSQYSSGLEGKDKTMESILERELPEADTSLITQLSDLSKTCFDVLSRFYKLKYNADFPDSYQDFLKKAGIVYINTSTLEIPPFYKRNETPSFRVIYFSDNIPAELADKEDSTQDKIYFVSMSFLREGVDEKNTQGMLEGCYIEKQNSVNYTPLTKAKYVYVNRYIISDKNLISEFEVQELEFFTRLFNKTVYRKRFIVIPQMAFQRLYDIENRLYDGYYDGLKGIDKESKIILINSLQNIPVKDIENKIIGYRNKTELVKFDNKIAYGAAILISSVETLMKNKIFLSMLCTMHTNFIFLKVPFWLSQNMLQ